jgi:hypothetical protein
VYEQHGRLLASFQDQLSDAVQGQLQALFQSLVSSFLAAAKIKVRGIAACSTKGWRSRHHIHASCMRSSTEGLRY